MSRKRLFIIGALVILLVNASIIGTLFLIDWIEGPSPEELMALKIAEEKAALDAIYAKLPPLPEFKSKATNLRSIGEAIALCEDKLESAIPERKSWEVNMIESRYVPSTEVYKIFIDYETASSIDLEAKKFKVTCEVLSEKRSIEIWKVDPAEE